MVIVDALVDIAELPRRVADQVQHLRIVAVPDAEQERQRLGVARLDHEIACGEIQILIPQGRRVAVDASIDAVAPHLPGSATRPDAAVLLLAISLATGAALRLTGLLAVVVELPHLLDRHGLRHGGGEGDQRGQSAKGNRLPEGPRHA